MTPAMTQYHLNAPLSAELGARAAAISAGLRSGKIGPDKSDEVSELIVDLTDFTMRYFFARPAEVFKLGLASRGMIDLGIRSTGKTIRMALRQVLPRLTPEQFKQVADYLEEAVLTARPPRKPT
ncbi:MAG: hypothetical protein JWQ90_4367 [Hydrocarboniphaga sp.]|uniref:hypothetical protein n=1 Tax=Hydrocarboniphaga sp. TaxID=2033016 RepID=UPI0026272616|nr:hypothetical protein [Hydrocarboniphaga sp.]MDB5971917.1 hypothetical protein [Hydrocarboniphaga sp.]